MDLFAFNEQAKNEMISQEPWMKRKKFVLITPANITEAIDSCIASGLYAFDIETTGLRSRVFNGCTQDRIVGVCLSPDGETGYYMPIRHKLESRNIPWSLAHRELTRLVESDSVAIFHNGEFDHEFLQFNGTAPLGVWDSPSKWEDSRILAWLQDNSRKQTGLKHLAEEMLGMKMIPLADLFSDPNKARNAKKDKKDGNLDFSKLDPDWEPTLWYACSDAICTYLLYKHLLPQVVGPTANPDQTFIYRAEKALIPSIRWMHRAGVCTDREKIFELIRIGQREWLDSMNSVYQDAQIALGRDVRPGWFRVFLGALDNVPAWDPNHVSEDVSFANQIKEAHKWAKQYRMDGSQDPIRKVMPKLNGDGAEEVSCPFYYDVTNPQDLGILLRELDIKGLQATEASGQVATSSTVLDTLVEEYGEVYPFLSKLGRLRSVSKALSTYLIPMVLDAFEEVDPATGMVNYILRTGFNSLGASTGRFKARTSKDPQRDGGTSVTFHGLPNTYDAKRPESLGRIREGLKARPGKVIVASDFSGVELRLVTILSREPKWLDEYYRCSSCSNRFERPRHSGVTSRWVPPFCPKCGSDKIGDIHTLTAQMVFGKDVIHAADFKAKRQAAKVLNFALCYGGSSRAAMNAVKCSESEGQQYKEAFDAAYSTLQKWWEQQKAIVRQHGYVVSMFGRKCSYPDGLLPRYSEKTDPVTGKRLRINNGGFIASAERNAINAPIQSASADVTKLAMLYVYRECRDRGWLDKVHMLATIHDEIIFEVDEDILEEAIDMIEHCMSDNPAMVAQAWDIPLTLDTEIGPNWTVPYNLLKLRQKGPDYQWPEPIAPFFKRKYIQYAAPPSLNLPEGTMLRLDGVISHCPSDPTLVGKKKLNPDGSHYMEEADLTVPVQERVVPFQPGEIGYLEPGVQDPLPEGGGDDHDHDHAGFEEDTEEDTEEDAEEDADRDIAEEEDNDDGDDGEDSPTVTSLAQIATEGGEMTVPREYVYRIPTYDVEFAIRLAKVLSQEEGKGTTRFRFQGPDGADITSHFESKWGRPFMASYVRMIMALDTLKTVKR